MKETVCPRCNSTNWRCWDSREHVYETEQGDCVSLPVAYLVCRDCDKAWIEEDVASDGLEDITDSLYQD